MCATKASSYQGPCELILTMAMNTGDPISVQHGSGANVGDDDERNGGGSNAAGSTEKSFEYISPPGLTEEQRADFERARQTPLSPIPYQRGDDD